MLKRMIFSVTAISVIAGCSTTVNVNGDPKVTGDTKVTGDSKKVFDADVTTWAKLNDKKAVTEFGITVPLKAVEGAPTAATAAPTRVVLQVPAEVKNTTFINTVTMDYNPTGHPPEKVYDLPHYDFHLY